MWNNNSEHVTFSVGITKMHCSALARIDNMQPFIRQETINPTHIVVTMMFDFQVLSNPFDHMTARYF